MEWLLVLWPAVGIGCHLYMCFNDTCCGKRGYLMDDWTWILMLPVAAIAGFGGLFWLTQLNQK